MKLLSLFDGSGGFPLAGALCGIIPTMASEVEPYPIAVTKSRFPQMRHLSDVSKVNGGEIEPVDVITFGSPCQDLSVAGKRAGLKHETNGDEETTRSGLFMEAVRIIKEMREATNGVYPTFALWENVPGAFSSNRGEDFRVVLEELVKIVEPSATVPPIEGGKWPYSDAIMGSGFSIAYRTFDAQYWGVPQRRRRIYLVADFRGERAPKILFEREGLRGYPPQGGSPWQGITRNAEESSGTADSEGISVTTPSYLLKIRGGVEVDSAGHKAGKGPLIQEEVSATLGVSQDQYLFTPTDKNILDDQGGQQITVRNDGKSPTLRAETHGNLPCVMSYDARGNGDGDTASTITGDHENRITDYTNVVCIEGNGSRPSHRGDGYRVSDKMYTLNTIERPAVCYQGGQITCPTNASNPQPGDPCHALTTDSRNYAVIPIHDQATRFSGKNGEQNIGKGNGLGVGNPDDPMNTLTSGDHHAVCYGIDQQGGKSGANYSVNVMPTLCSDSHGTPHAVSYLASGKDTTGCLMASGYDKLGGQEMFSEDYTVIEERAKPSAQYWNGDNVTGTLTANNAGGSQRMPDKENFNCVIQEEVVGVMATSQVNAEITDGKISPCITARAGTGGNNTPLVGCKEEEKVYIVRRLTPTECARLQGFPDWWGDIDPKEDFTDEEYAFWLEVRNTHATINGRQTKEYTKPQMLTWYNKLHTDSAEYKMWGNGIALPTALYVMQGIADELTEQEGGADHG